MINEVKDLFKKLGLKYTGDHLEEFLSAEQEKMDLVLNHLKPILNKEVELKNEKQLQNRIKQSRITDCKTINDFDFSVQTSIKQKDIEELMKMEWLEEPFNILFFGPPGVGNYAKYLLM